MGEARRWPLPPSLSTSNTKASILLPRPQSEDGAAWLDRLSNSTLDRTARLLLGDEAPTIGTSKSRHTSPQLQGSKRKGKEIIAGASASSATLIPKMIFVPSDEADPSATPMVMEVAVILEHRLAQGQDHDNDATGNDILDVIIIDQEDSPDKKMAKKCTYDVWQFFTKKDEIVEVDGKKYIQTWGHCNFQSAGLSTELRVTTEQVDFETI